MISIALARALRDSGLVWHPTVGDAFCIDRIEADADVFYLSDLTVEAQRLDRLPVRERLRHLLLDPLAGIIGVQQRGGLGSEGVLDHDGPDPGCHVVGLLGEHVR